MSFYLQKDPAPSLGSVLIFVLEHMHTHTLCELSH